MPKNNLESYFKGQQVSLQWLPVLRAMALELSANADAKDLRILFSKIGDRFAKEAQDCFQDIQTLTQLEESLNDFWSRINWGWVDLAEVQGGIDITHQAAPLAEAFGDETLEWSSGLLEGFYQCVFNLLDTSNTMAVRSIDDATDGMTIRLRFGRKEK
jgi:hypothetical protein